MDKTANNYVLRIHTYCKSLPLDLKVMAIISIAFYSFSLFGRQLLTTTQLQEVIPFTGWSYGQEYGFIPVFLLLGPFSKNAERHLKLVRLLIMMVFSFRFAEGILEWSYVTPDMYNSSNPYLKYHYFRPFCTVLLPIVWFSINSVMLWREKGMGEK